MDKQIDNKLVSIMNIKTLIMRKFYLATLCVVLLGLFSTINADAQNVQKISEEAVKNLKPYPEVIDSLERHVIFLEKKDNEDVYRIELFAGKTMDVDCNRHRLMGSFEKEDVKGWGYSYYKFESNGQIISTMMACHGPKQSKFISGDSQMVRYNSRLPIVVYLPHGMGLQYRLWTAGETQKAEKR